MLAQHVEIINLKEDKHQHLWKDCLDYIRENCQSDMLYDNYTNLVLADYEYFNAAVYQGEIASFGAVERSSKKWGPRIARVLTKFWMHPKYRTKGLTKWRDDSIKWSPTILKPQLEYLKSRNDLHAAIITREGNYLRSFREIVRLANTVSENEFVIKPGRYNTCEPYIKELPESCKQFVAIASLNKSLSSSEIFNRFSDLGFFKKI